MSEFVQAYVKATGKWRVFHVKSGEWLDKDEKQAVDEIDPIEPEPVEQPEYSDPMGDFR